MVRTCLNRAEPALTHDNGIANVKSHSSMILLAQL